MIDLLDFETVADASAATAGAPAGDGPSQTAPAAEPPAGAPGGETDASAVATEPAPAWTPDNPVFLDTVDQRAAEIAQAQVEPILGFLRDLAQPEAVNPQEGQFDWGAVNAYEDDFGPRLAQGIAATVHQALAPVHEFMQQMQRGQQDFAQQQQAQAADQASADWISANAADLPDVAKDMIRPLARHFMPEFEARYGFTERAGEAAFRKALETVKEMRGGSDAAAVAANAEHLATLASARTDLAAGGSGSGLVTLPDQPLSARERIAKYAPQLQNAARNTQ